MTGSRLSQVRVGMFVFIVLLAFAIAILVMGSQTRYFEKQYRLRAAFDDIGGLLEGAPVQLAGVQVGRVKDIRFAPTIGEKKVWVELLITRKVQDRIRRDSIASIGTLGLLGDKFVDITLGSEDQPMLTDGQTIRTVTAPGFEEIVKRSTELLDNAISITASLDSMLATFRKSETRLTLEETIRSVGNIVMAIEQGEGLLHSLIYQPDQGKILDDLAQTSAALRQLAIDVQQKPGFLHSLIYEPEPAALSQLTAVLATLQRLLREVEQGEGMLHALLYDGQGGKAVADLQQAIRSLRRTLQQVQSGEGVLSQLLLDPQYRSVATDLQQVVQNLKVTTQRIAQGEGTLGALIQDPTIYENLAALLSGAQRSWILRTLIRSTTEKGKNRSAE